MPDTVDERGALELARLARGEHPSPHSLLGIHEAANGRGMVVRALDPNAETMFVLVGGSTPKEARGGARRYPMKRIEGTGLFAREFPEAPGPFRYRLEAAARGRSDVREDPYRFPPTLGDLDLLLLGEGNHRELYRKLGAHPRRLDDVDGFSFAVWAPAARGVALVGDFNGWTDGRHPMRSIGGSGVW
ncbi:MAG TPA: 1,4-alpha-glucan branching enzyme, partial [Candidatus Polarisedimenticolia bacterium]|nr:1,4-alpha-glucan branching enzyme [Candidatus Polarisedimenticolia bacterium]